MRSDARAVNEALARLRSVMLGFWLPVPLVLVTLAVLLLFRIVVW